MVAETPDINKSVKELRKKYPSPRLHDESFTKYWKEFIVDIPRRANFKRNHLFNLEILCGLHAENEALDEQISREGSTYICGTKYGEQIKAHPAVSQRDKILVSIANYTKLLDVKPIKDKPNPAPVDPDAGKWK